jgi:hypothetical protein
MSTKQGGNVTVNPWGSPLNAGWEWCDANSEANWSPGGWQYGFNRIDIFAPGLSDFNASGDTASGLRVTTEKALGFTLGINNGLYLAGRPIVLHLDLGKRNGSCNVTLSTLLWPLDGLASYAVSLSAFAVTDACGLADVATASLDDQVRRLPNYNDTENGGPAAYQAALEEMAGARASAMTLLKSSDIARVRFRLMDVNDSIKTDGVYASDVTIKGAVTIQ